MEKNDLMLDLETMGLGVDCAVLSIGAIFFNRDTGDTGREFSAHIRLQTCLDAGLTVDADTLLWWMKQPDAARKALINGQELGALDLDCALVEFSRFVRDQYADENVRLWCKGPEFDAATMKNLYRNVLPTHPLPWKHFNVRCVRTPIDLAGGSAFERGIAFSGVKHDALDDCRHQIKLVCAAVKKTRGDEK